MKRRTVILGAAVTGLSGATSFGAASAAGPRRASVDPVPVLRARIGGRWRPREEVLQWEARRIQVAARKLRGEAVGALLGDLDALVLRRATSTADVVRDRRRLAESKLEMGDDAVMRAVSTDLAVSGAVTPLAAAMGRWSISHIELDSDRGSAAGFVRWYREMVRRNRPMDGLVACPDHYRLATSPDGGQEVVEVTGGSMLASRFVVAYDDADHVSVPPDPRYPRRIVGSANAGGTVIGSVSHQARDLRRGFELSLNVAFPRTLPFWFVSEHRWHLACEFSNWVEAYARESGV